MIRPFLLIGVGGSGGMTLRFTWHELEKRMKALRDRGWDEGIPVAWQFLHVDVPQAPDGYGPAIPRVLDGAQHYLGLATHPNEYAIYDDQIAHAEGTLPAMVGWRPDPTTVTTPIWMGAGQRRALGRVVALSELGRIRTAVTQACDRLSGDEAARQLQKLGGILGTQIETQQGQGVVVGSLGGGAGSGAFLEVCELLLAQGPSRPWLRESMTVLFTPEIFQGEGARSGMQPNALAAISELLSAYEHEGDLSREEQTLFEIGGGGTIRGRRALKYNMVIGRQNEAGLVFNSSTEVFEAVGKSLSSFIANPRIQSGFTDYAVVNADGPVADLGLVQEDHLGVNPCNSMGFATIGLGYRLFGQYTSQRLARAAVERLLHAHERHRAPDDRRPESKIIEERAEAMRIWFFNLARLYELNESNPDEEVAHDDVLDALRDREKTKKIMADIEAQIRSSMSRENGLFPSRWADLFAERIELERQPLATKLREDRIERATRWVGDIQATVLNATATAMANEGIPVTVELLRLLETQLEQAAASLRSEADSKENGGGEQLALIRSTFASLREQVMLPGSPEVEGAAIASRRCLTGREEGTARRFAAAFVDDLREQVLPPLREAVQKAGRDLLASSRGGQVGEQLAGWPNLGGEVPARLKPAPNEFHLTGTTTFPDLFDSSLVSIFDETRDPERPLAPGTAASSAVREIITGLWTSVAGERTQQDLIVQREGWHCADNAVRPADLSPQSAAYLIDVNPLRMLDRSETWIEDRQGLLAQMHFGTLAEHLDPAAADAGDRAARFTADLERALKAARPLVGINRTALSKVHPAHRLTFSVAIDPIPIGANHPARKDIEQLLLHYEVASDQARLDAFFDANWPGSEIEIATFFEDWVHPLIFGSLVTPISDDWNRRRVVSSRERRRFWEFRRARTLTSFTPLSPEQQRVLAVGWLVGQLLGQVTIAQPITVWSPTDDLPKHLEFPEYLLGGQPNDGTTAFPALLESLPLAFLSFAAGDTEELEAYQRLRELGELGDLAREPAIIDRWIINGTLEEGAPTPSPARAGTTDGTPEERANAIIGVLERIKVAYEELVKQRVNDRFSFDPPREWEMRHVMSRAVADLMHRVRQAQQRGHAANQPDDPSRMA